MMEEWRRFEGDEENNEQHRRDAKENDGKRKKADREKHFAEMKSRGGANIKIEVSMVDIVKSPEERDHVIDPMPPPIRVIHEQKRGDQCQRRWQLPPIQQTKMSILCPRADCQRDRQHCYPDNPETRDGQTAITDKATQRTEMLSPERETPLQQK